MVAIGYEHEPVWLADLACDRLIPLRADTQDAVGVAFVDAEHLVILTDNGTLRCTDTVSQSSCWNTELSRPTVTVSRYQPRIISIGDRLLCVTLSAESAAAVLVDTTTGRVVQTLRGNDDFRTTDVTAALFDASTATWLLTTSRDRILRARATDSAASTISVASTVPCALLLISPRMDGVLSISRTGVLTFHDERSLQPVASLVLSNEAITGAHVVSRTGDLVLSSPRGRLSVLADSVGAGLADETNSPLTRASPPALAIGSRDP